METLFSAWFCMVLHIHLHSLSLLQLSRCNALESLDILRGRIGHVTIECKHAGQLMYKSCFQFQFSGRLRSMSTHLIFVFVHVISRDEIEKYRKKQLGNWVKTVWELYYEWGYFMTQNIMTKIRGFSRER